MKTINILIFTFIIKCHQMKYLNFKIESKNQILNNCINKILAKVALPDSLIYLIDSNFQIKLPVVYQSTSNRELKIFEFRKPDIYIINTEKNLTTIIEHLSQFAIFNSRSQFLIVCNFFHKEMLTQLSRYFIYNVIILETQTRKIITHNPFMYEEIFPQNILPKNLGTCENFYFERIKVPKFWRNSSSSAIYHDFCPYLCEQNGRIKGWEYRIYKIFREVLNFKKDVILKNVFGSTGLEKSNGTYHGILKFLQDRKVLIFINLYEAHPHLIQDFDLVPLYLGAPQFWVVPNALRQPYWKLICFSFSLWLWLVILITLIVLTLIWHFSEKRDFVVSFLIFFQVLSESSSFEIISSGRTFSRIIIFATLLPFLVLSTTFKTEMIKSLTSISFDKQINSLEDIVKNKLFCNLTNSIKKAFSHSEEIFGQYIQNCAIHEAEQKKDEIFDRIAFKRDLVTTSRTTVFKEALGKFYKLGYKEPLIYKIPQAALYNYLYLFLSKGSPFYHRFLEIAGKLQDYGFISTVMKLNRKRADSTVKLHERIKSDDLTMEQILVSFYVLCLGFLTSFLVLLGEILKI